MTKKIVFILISVILVIIAIFAFGVIAYQNSYDIFQADGYIISNADNETTRYYFMADGKYRISNEMVKFQDTDDNDVTIDTKNYIHYTDGSISTLDKAVILDLNTLNNSNYQYYNIYDGSILTKQDSNYQISYLDGQLNFNSFILKISENKYMFVAPTMRLTIGEEERVIENNYLEVTYLDGNVIRLDNQELSLQNISSTIYLTIGDTVIDLMSKNILVNDEEKLNLTNITIDKDDNVEIPKDDNNTVIADEEEEEGTGNSGESERPQFPNINNGIIDTEIDDTEEIISENAQIKDAEFTVTSLEVTANMLRSEVQITDSEGVLSGDIDIKIVEAATNRIVYQNSEMAGNNFLQIECQTLNPETNYILVVNSDYVKNDVTYNKDFVQKTFVTDSVGLTIEKNYFTTDTLSFQLIKDDFTNLVSVDASLLSDDGSLIRTITVDLSAGSTINEVTFNELEPDAEYEIRLTNFIYSDAAINDVFDISSTYKTLKQRPTLGTTTFTIDKRNGEFNLMIGNVDDPNNGIVSYRYDIYDARTISDNPTLITSIEKSDQSSANVKVDGKLLERGVPYVFKLVAIFNDNEKEYEYTTDYSSVMMMDGVAFPTLRFEQEEVTFEKIVGTLIITDEGNTIDLNDGSTITIVYTDSVGNTNSYTTSGNLNIPVNVNNLRSNETYSFAVYANVNLQDGNPIISNCYIGSVIVNTKSPDSFRLEYEVNEETVSKAFDITANLTNEEGLDTSLEASTLSGLQFNLYQGRTTNSTLVKSIRKVDRNLDPYTSTLQDEYYDNDFTIDPSLFGLRNQDLTAEYYTIEVTGAYDYTVYQNELPITNNVITVKTNGFVPDIPTDPNKAIDVIEIRNKDAGDRYRDDLNPETIVGYRIRASYDNSQRYAKTITYNLHDATTGEVIDTLTYDVESDGSIDYVEFYLEDGLPFGTTDKEFRRGGRYYFSYTAVLDLNLDGTGETAYPTTDVTLRSINLTPQKQQATLYLYPSTNTSNNFIWNYSYSDIDHASCDSLAYYTINDIEYGGLPLTETAENQYNTLNFPISTSGNFRIYLKEALTNDPDSVQETTKVYQYYEGVYTPVGGNYQISLETNRVLFSFTDYNSNRTFYDRVAGATIIFKGASKTIEVSNLTIQNGSIIVDLSDIEDLIHETIETEVVLYYDSGIYGFDTQGDYFALQALQVEDSANSFYYVIDSSGQLSTSTSAMNSFFTKTFSITDKLLTIKDRNNRTFSLPLRLDEQGLSYNYEYISPKKLNSKTIDSTGSPTFSFNMIIPGISLLSESGASNIAATLNEAHIKAELYGASSERIKDNKIFIEVYQTNETGSESELVKKLEFNVDDFDSEIVISDLIPNTNYYLNFKANVFDGSDYVYTSLYDMDYQNNNRNYYFKTLNNIGISNIDVTYTASSYQERNLRVTYNLEELVGYDRIEYEVYKIISDGDTVNYELVDLDIEPDYLFRSNMTKYISIPTDCGVEAGYQYQIRIKPYSKVSLGDEKTDVELEQATLDYDFISLYNPYIGVTSSVYQSSILEFRINIRDYNRTIVNGTYKIQIYNNNGEEVTPEEYKDVDFNTTTINNRISLSPVEIGERYTIRILYQLDLNNTSTKITDETSVYTTTIYENEGISTGTIYADVNLDDQTKVTLSFFDSYRLTDITSIRYSIYDNNGYSIDNTMDFVPTLNTSGGINYYSITLPDTISNQGIYYIAIQFLKNGELVGEDNIEYRYIT